MPDLPGVGPASVHSAWTRANSCACAQGAKPGGEERARTGSGPGSSLRPAGQAASATGPHNATVGDTSQGSWHVAPESPVVPAGDGGGGGWPLPLAVVRAGTSRARYQGTY